ncbi:LysM peptidoglycan-binding domain-containing protein [Enterococcus sp. LJL90]
MATANDVVNWMLSKVGIKENPMGSNNVEFNTKYYGRDVSGSAYAWCQAMIWCCFQELGISNLYGTKSAYTVFVASAFNQQGRFFRSNPQPGDMVFFDWGGSKNISAIDHVGIVVSVNADGSVNTVEGNVSNQVMKMRRTMQFIVGFGRPAYGASGSSGGNSGSTPSTGTYTVIAGDSLWKISQKFNTTVASLKQLNNLSSDLIFIGQTLKTSGSSSTPSSHQIAVDGYWGSATTRRIQQVLGVTVDGIKGPETYKAIQWKVGTTADGIIGPNTIRAMQKYFGTVQDGIISEPSLMVKAMQTRLNQNTF